MSNILTLIEGRIFYGDFNIENQISVNGNRNLITFLNPFSYYQLRKNIILLQNFDIILIDGILLLLFLRLFGFKNIKRYSFDYSSLADKFFNYCIRNNIKVFFIGSTDKNIKMSIKNLQNAYNNLNLLGYNGGYFSSEQEYMSLIEKIIRLNPDVVLVGMGALNQEKLLLALSNSGWTGIGFTCGGFFHQIKNKLNYYPSLINKLHLRWFYRMLKEPHLLYRYLIIYPLFIIFFIKDFYNYKRINK